MAIQDGKDVHGLPLAAWMRTPGIRVRATNDGRALPPSLDHVAQAAQPALAIVNHGRWLALCPECPGGAELVWRETPLFYCHACGNRAIKGLYRTVAMPSAEEIAALEASLGRRPKHEQGWYPDRVPVAVGEGA